MKRTLDSKSSDISLTPKSTRLFLLQFHCAKFHQGTAAPFCRNAVDSVEADMGSTCFIFFNDDKSEVQKGIPWRTLIVLRGTFSNLRPYGPKRVKTCENLFMSMRLVRDSGNLGREPEIQFGAIDLALHMNNLSNLKLKMA